MMYPKMRILSFLLTTTMILSLFLTVPPVMQVAGAEPNATFNLATGLWSDGLGNTAHNCTWDGTVLIVNDGANIGVTGMVTSGQRIEIAENAKANVILNNVSISIASLSKFSTFLLKDKANLTLVIEGENVLTSGLSCAGIEVPLGATISISGSGKLKATGGDGSAGIGGRSYYYDSQVSSGPCGDITINSGEITAVGSTNAAGIGGGYLGTGGNIIINGGTINATSGNNGAGIGGGNTKPSGSITINGGMITAKGGAGAGIGGGNTGEGGNIIINGGTVSATAVGGACIGGGNNAAAGDIIINGGMIIAGSPSGIGGGDTNVAGTVTINGNAVVVTPKISDTDISRRKSGILFINNVGTFYGTNVTLTENITMPSSGTLGIPANAVLTISNNKILVNNATITNHGTILNNGSVINNGTVNNYGAIQINDIWTGNKIKPFNTGIEPKIVSYSGSPIQLENLFSPHSNGMPTYSIEIESTGDGIISDGKLTVTQCGEFIIGFITEENTHYAKSEKVTSTLTVKKLENAGIPTIAKQPQNATVGIGTTYHLTVEAISPDGGDLSYQWYSNTINSNSGGTEIKGATGVTYAAPIHAVGTKYYYVEVTNINEFAEHMQATTTSKAAMLTVNKNEVISVTVSPKTVDIQKGKEQQFQAKVVVQNGAKQTVTWSVKGNNSKDTKISTSGKLTVASNETAKTLTVTATSTIDNTKFGTATVTIKAILQTPSLTVKEVPKNKAVKKGSKITLKAPKNTTLYYTKDGRKPTLKSKKVKPGKSAKITITQKTKVRVFAVKKGCAPSKEAKRTYRAK